MRSRYAAFAVGDVDHLFRTWHPRTRPEDLRLEPGQVWTGLTIVDVTESEVEFVASYTTPAGPGLLHERSRFEQRASRWVYVDGDLGLG